MLNYNPAALVAAARAYADTPFKHRGRGHDGLDCAGLIICALRDLGAEPQDLEAYGRLPARDGLREAVQRNLGQPAGTGAAGVRAGDVLLMRFSQEPHHVALATEHPLGGLGMLHAYAEAGKVCEHRIEEIWASRIIEFYRPQTGGAE